MDTVLADRYRLGERIGTGGSSHVYRAHDDRLDRPVAVKLLDEAAAETADPAARRRFESESRTAAQFFHPNAVAILDAGSDQGNLFLVMELVTGGSLAQRLADRGALPSSEVAALGAQLASALAAAHSVGIVHRDVKPANILFDAADNAKLADFGIARRFDEIEQSLTSTGMVMGTRHYVSPEQARGQPLGPASDIFSLGVTLYEAVTGTRPPSAVERPVDDRLDVRALDPTIDATLAAVIERATAIPIEARFPDAARMARALAGADPAPPTRSVPPPIHATLVMPPHLVPQPATAAPATAPVTAPVTERSMSTAGPPAATATPLMADRLLHERRRRQRFFQAAAVAAVLLFVVVALVVTLGGDDGSDLAASTTVEPAVSVTSPAPTTVTTTIAPTTIAPTTVPPTTVAPTTVAPTTLPPTTLPPTTLPPTIVVQELIPGFPVPVDIEDFLRILLLDPELVGQAGDDLANEFADLLDAPPGRRSDRREKLRDHIERWSDQDELDPTIAAVANHYLDELNTGN